MTPSPLTIGAAVMMLAGVTAYAIFTGADFGGGIWDLLAGGPERGARPRQEIDRSLTPVWEGNQVWIVFGLVTLWTAFPAAFAAIMKALFVPLVLSLMGLFLRGVGFAFRHEAERLVTKSIAGATFAASSFLTPFFLGTVVAAIATGRVPAAPRGNVPSAWTSPTAIMTGFLFLAAAAFVAAVYLVGDSHRRRDEEMVRYFSRRAVASGLVTAAFSAGCLVLLRGSVPYTFGRLTGPALPLVAYAWAAGAAALGLILLRRIRLVRVIADSAVVAGVAAWGLAQYPWLLPGRMTLRDGSAPPSALAAQLSVAGLALVVVVPAFAYLYWLHQHDRLEVSEAAEPPGGAAAARNGTAARERPGPAAPARHGRAVIMTILTASVLAGLARKIATWWRHRR